MAFSKSKSFTKSVMPDMTVTKSAVVGVICRTVIGGRKVDALINNDGMVRSAARFLAKLFRQGQIHCNIKCVSCIAENGDMVLADVFYDETDGRCYATVVINSVEKFRKRYRIPYERFDLDFVFNVNDDEIDNEYDWNYILEIYVSEKRQNTV